MKKQKLILVASFKGGPGKSTLATNLASYCALASFDVALVDADHGQKSTINWGIRRESFLKEREGGQKGKLDKHRFPIVEYKSGNVAEIIQLADENDYTFIDVGGYKGQELIEILQIADIVVSPTRVSLLDIEQLYEFHKVFEKINMHRKKVMEENSMSYFPIPCVVVLNSVSPNPFSIKTKEAIDVINTFDHFKLCPRNIKSRDVYVTGVDRGLSVIEQNDEKAKREMTVVTKFLLNSIIDIEAS